MSKIAKRLIVVCAFVLLLCLSGCTEEGHIADKVSVMGVNLGGMDKEEAIGALSNVILDGDTVLLVNVDGEETPFKTGDAGAEYDLSKTVDYIIEDSKGIFSGWSKKEYDMKIAVDSEKLENIIKSFEKEGEAKKIEVAEGGIRVTNEVPPKTIDRKAFLEGFEKALGKDGEGKITLEYIEGECKASNSEVLQLFLKNHMECEYVKAEDGTVYVEETLFDDSFDEEMVLKEMEKHTEYGEEYVIKCEIRVPKHSREELENALFRDNLGEYTTSYSTSSANRQSNINLAAKTINGTVLMPGEEFSFNATLGERTVARGYKTAGAYVAGKTVDQVGGGICQVSSTLYNSVLLSNLEIVSRRSHQMTVSYVPLGRDATVNWGTTDFRFKNNTEYPIKIEGTTQNKKVTFKIIGTETIPDRRVEILTSTVAVLPIQTIEEEDPLMPYGETKTEKGSSGYVVDAVRVIYSGDKELSRESLTRSKYNPKNTIVTVGTLGKPLEMPTETVEDYILPPGLGEEIPVAEPVEIATSQTGL